MAVSGEIIYSYGNNDTLSLSYTMEKSILYRLRDWYLKDKLQNAYRILQNKTLMTMVRKAFLSNTHMHIQSTYCVGEYG